VGDLVYVSTKNLSLPKGRARKLTPKYIGPFPIIEIMEPGATYRLDLSPNDDRCFPGRQLHQIPGFGENLREWAVNRILSHLGQGSDAVFKVLWQSPDRG
jgi:hypothetical protein